MKHLCCPESTGGTCRTKSYIVYVEKKNCVQIHVAFISFFSVFNYSYNKLATNQGLIYMMCRHYGHVPTVVYFEWQQVFNFSEIDVTLNALDEQQNKTKVSSVKMFIRIY